MTFFTKIEKNSHKNQLIELLLSGLQNPFESSKDMAGEFFDIAFNQGYDEGYKTAVKDAKK